jgi:carbon monoxide dehydrogenase subunit G
MQLTFDLQQPIELVFDYLTDMQKFVSVHPVISKIEPMSGNRYLVHETLKLGPIPLSFTYTVTLESNMQNRTIVIRATVMKLTKIDMSYTLHPMAGCTKVEETIGFRSYLPIKSVMQNIFRKQHTQLFQNINRLK